jgi:hypothetical protein
MHSHVMRFFLLALICNSVVQLYFLFHVTIMLTTVAVIMYFISVTLILVLQFAFY